MDSNKLSMFCIYDLAISSSLDCNLDCNLDYIKNNNDILTEFKNYYNCFDDEAIELIFEEIEKMSLKYAENHNIIWDRNFYKECFEKGLEIYDFPLAKAKGKTSVLKYLNYTVKKENLKNEVSLGLACPRGLVSKSDFADFEILGEFGYTYDENRDAFIPPLLDFLNPNKWQINEDTFLWEQIS